MSDRTEVTGAEGGATALRRRDEILQVLFWMGGEGLGDAARPDGIARLLGEDTDARLVAEDLAALEEAGLVREEEGSTFRLTERGRAEGGRRFADAFQGMTAQAHGECSDPDCDCHTDPEAAAECHLRRHVHATDA